MNFFLHFTRLLLSHFRFLQLFYLYVSIFISIFFPNIFKFLNKHQVELCFVQVADEAIPLTLGVNEEYSLDVSADGECMISAQTVP